METTILIIFQLSLISEREQIITYINDLHDVLLTVLVRAQDCTQAFAGREGNTTFVSRNVHCKNVTYFAIMLFCKLLNHWKILYFQNMVLYFI